MSTDDLGAQELSSLIFVFGRQKALAERALAQVPDDAALHRQIDPESNSLAVIVRHIAGNLRSRWTDFLTMDGEKPDRNRDREFEPTPQMDRAALLAEWEAGWRCLSDTLHALRPEDLARTVTIRGEALSVTEAAHRQLAHYAYHVGQIVFLARHLVGPSWRSLSIPRGQSRAARGDYKGGR